MHIIVRCFASPRMTETNRLTAQIRINPTTADPMPTMRKILSGVASALSWRGASRPGLPQISGLQHKQDSHTDEEVGERYGPHRMATPRYQLFFLL